MGRRDKWVSLHAWSLQAGRVARFDTSIQGASSSVVRANSKLISRSPRAAGQRFVRSAEEDPLIFLLFRGKSQYRMTEFRTVSMTERCYCIFVRIMYMFRLYRTCNIQTFSFFNYQSISANEWPRNYRGFIIAEQL